MPMQDGQYVTPGWVNGQSPAISAAELTAMGQGIEQGSRLYGISLTAANAAAKTADVGFSGNLAPYYGMVVKILFVYGNTAANPTLNVNGTGAYPILINGQAAGSGAWGADCGALLLFTGNRWHMIGAGTSVGTASTTSYGITKLTDSTSSADTTTAATPNSVRQAYDLADGKASKAVQIGVTLTASGWSGSSAPYTQTVSVSGLTGTSIGRLSLVTYTSAAQRAAAREAMLYVTAQAAGSLTVTADGTKPDTDIPCTVTILG